MTIYIDNDYKCYVSPTDDCTAIETDCFDGKCQSYIEGYRFVPSGKTWTRDDGVQFSGEMIAPWKNYNELDAIQRTYEQNLITQYEAALSAIEQALEVQT